VNKQNADFLLDLFIHVDKALIVGDFNIHIDNSNDVLGLVFKDFLKLFWSQAKHHGAHLSL